MKNCFKCNSHWNLTLGIRLGSKGSQYWYTICQDCGNKTKHYETFKEAIAEWNNE